MIINLSKIKKMLEEEGIMPTSNDSKYNINTDASKREYRGQSRRIIRQKVRTDEEYQRMYEETGKKGLNPEDMKFIDQTAHEDPSVPS